VMDLVLLNRIAQRAHDVLLPHDLVEGAGTVTSVKGERFGHRRLSPVYPGGLAVSLPYQRLRSHI
jgi:hypothetical protein